MLIDTHDLHRLASEWQLAADGRALLAKAVPRWLGGARLMRDAQLMSFCASELKQLLEARHVAPDLQPQVLQQDLEGPRR